MSNFKQGLSFSGEKDGALLYVSKFKWGKNFLKLNKELLDKYSACQTSTEVVEIQNQHIKQLEEESRAERGESGTWRGKSSGLCGY